MSPLDTIRRRRPPSPSTTSDPAPAPEPVTAEVLPPATAATAPAAAAAGTFAERLVARTAGFLSGSGGGTSTRRRFLARTAVVGSALAVNPVSFLLKPGTAYGAVCGSCGDGWTAFCCTINSGKNSCPPNSFVAGWWKADNAAYCCGGPRYIIDCNATCPTQCSCRCAGAACDGRRVCCNQFRYGQCNQQISCYGPVVCRVAVCITPWAYDAACSTRTLTDNATSQHGAACLSDECDTAITRKYYALNGPDGFLGLRTQTERATPEGRGRYAVFQGGRLYSSSATGAREIHGTLYDVWAAAGATNGAYGFPTTDVLGDARVRYSLFQQGAVYRWSEGTFGVPNPYHALHQFYGGVSSNGSLGLPTAAAQRSADERAIYINFERGRIYRRGDLTVEIHGAIFTKHEALGGVHGVLGHVQSNVVTLADGRGRSSTFEHGGAIYYTAQTGARAVWDDVLEGYQAYGGPTSPAGYPTSDRVAVGDGRGFTFTTEHAQVWSTPTTGGHVVPPGLLAQYTGQGGPGGALGYPTAKAVRVAGGKISQQFEHGTLSFTPPEVAFVKAAHEDFLDRAPSSAELDLYATAIGNGAWNRATLLRQLANSEEYIRTLVEKLYVDTLGRPGDADGTAFWVGQLKNRRLTVASVAGRFYSSPEYFTGIGGGTVRTWIADLFQKVLGRAASSGDLDYWEGQTATRGRTRVATTIYQAAESRRARVNALYQALLGRPADQAGIDHWSPRILREGDLALAVSLAATQEYLTRAQTRFPA